MVTHPMKSFGIEMPTDWWPKPNLGEAWLISGKHTKNYGKIHHFQWENPLFLWPFSIAVWHNQRVNLHFPMVFLWFSLKNIHQQQLLVLSGLLVSHVQTSRAISMGPGGLGWVSNFETPRYLYIAFANIVYIYMHTCTYDISYSLTVNIYTYIYIYIHKICTIWYIIIH